MNFTPTQRLLDCLLMIGCILAAPENSPRGDGAAPDFSPNRRLGQFVARSGFGSVETDVDAFVIDLSSTTEEPVEPAVLDFTAAAVAPAPEPDTEEMLLCSVCPPENACDAFCSCETGECMALMYVAGGKPVPTGHCSQCKNKKCDKMWWCAF